MLGKAASSTWKEFAKLTSVHGFKYSTVKRLVDRCFWVLLPIMSMITAAYLMLQMFQRYKREPTKTVYESQNVPISLQVFAGVSICAPRRYTPARIEKLLNNSILPANVGFEDMKKMIPQLVGFLMISKYDNATLNTLTEWFKLNRFNSTYVIEELLPPCEDMIVKCRWEGNDTPCEKLFRRSTTIYGKCCSFNHDDDLKGDSFKAVRTDLFGPQVGLSVVVDPKTSYNRQVYHIMDSFKIVLHKVWNYVGRNNIDIFLPLKREVHLSFTPTITRSGDLIYSLEPKDRKCYLPTEKKLKYFKYYSKPDCLLECEIRLCVNRCKCQPYQYPNDDDGDDVVCGPDAIACLNEHFKYIALSKWVQQCNCPPQCDDDELAAEINTIPLEAIEFNPDPLYNGLTGNQSLVHVYFYKETSTKIKRMVSSYWVDLLSSFGGVFNLFIGCSFLSILEVLYFLLVRYPSTLRNMSKKTFTPPKA